MIAERQRVLPKWAQEFQGLKGLGRELVWCNNNRNRGCVLECKVVASYPIRPRPIPAPSTAAAARKIRDHDFEYPPPPPPPLPAGKRFDKPPRYFKAPPLDGSMSARAFDYGAITRDVLSRLGAVRDVPFSEMRTIPDNEPPKHLYRFLRGEMRRAYKRGKWRM